MVKNLFWKKPIECTLTDEMWSAILLRNYEKVTKLTNQMSLNAQKEASEQMDDMLRPEQRFFWDFQFASEKYLYIVDKQKQKRNFKFNSLQKALYKALLYECPIRTLIIKARKFGISTFILLLYYWDCITTPNTSSVIIAEEFEATKRLFHIVNFAHENLDEKFKPKTKFDNVRELLLEGVNSRFYVGSAQKEHFGRGDTINNLHCSEFAFWPDPEGLLGSALSEAVPEQTGNIIIETTPSRMPYLKELVATCKEKGKPFNFKFFPWHIFPEYREEIENEKERQGIEEELTAEEKLAMKANSLDWEQMKFWLTKRRKLKKKVWQEYPMDDNSCFMASDEHSFFDTRSLQELYLIVRGISFLREMPNGIRIYNEPIPDKRYLIAADTSGGGIDSTFSAAVVLRFDNAEEVAELKERLTPPQLAKVLADLGYFYNTALLVVERNNHGHSVINTLENQLFYPNLYHHIDVDYAEWAKKISKVGKVGSKIIDQGEVGWITNAKTKPIMMDELRDEVIDEKQMMIKSLWFVEECFGVKSKGEKIYSEGYMDTVIARAIAWQVRKRSMPAALHIAKSEKEIISRLPSAVFGGEEFQTLNRKGMGIRHKVNRAKKTLRAPWEL